MLNLYRKYRPISFEELKGQDIPQMVIKNAVKSKDIFHAYLFEGPRGTGKTTLARIFAMCLNCEKGITTSPCGKCSSCVEIKSGTSIDVIEIDAASNTQVEKIRETVINIAGLTTMRDRYRVFIIDEAHMLSDSSFNALLKTLEEPPKNTCFILATTDPAKIPSTISSRCIKLKFRLLEAKEIHYIVKDVAEKEGISIDDESINLISEHAAGSVRDALSILEAVCLYAGKNINISHTMDVLGAVDRVVIEDIAKLLKNSDLKGAIKKIDSLYESGYQPSDICKGLLKFYRERLYKVFEGGSGDVDEVIRNIRMMSKALEEMRYSTTPHIILEYFIYRISKGPQMLDVDVNIVVDEKGSKTLTKNFDRKALLKDAKAMDIKLHGLLNSVDFAQEGECVIISGAKFLIGELKKYDKMLEELFSKYGIKYRLEVKQTNKFVDNDIPDNGTGFEGHNQSLTERIIEEFGGRIVE